MKKNFELFMSQLQETNQTLDFFCDFDKISQNVEYIKLSLCMLNSLIGASDMHKASSLLDASMQTSCSSTSLMFTIYSIEWQN